MKCGLKTGWVRRVAAIGMGAIGCGLGLAWVSPAVLAQAAYGSYVGVGGSLGFTNDSGGAGVVAVRYRLLEVPISLRAQVLISDATAIVPTVSYDIPLNWYTDAYIGAGIALQDSQQNTSPIGNQTAFVLQPGVDHRIPRSDFVVFGNAIIAFDSYRNRNDTGVAVQGGVGLRF